MKKSVLFFLLMFLGFLVRGQTNLRLDGNQLSEQLYKSLQEKLTSEYFDRMEKIKEQIPTNIENYRQKRINELENQLLTRTNFDYLLDEYEVLGLNNGEVGLNERINEVYNQLAPYYTGEETIDKDKIRSALSENWKSVATAAFDKESADMIEGYYNLFADAKKKMEALNDIAQDTDLDEAELIEKLKKYGLSGDYLERLKPLERVMRTSWNKIPDPAGNYEILKNAFASENPSHKIEALFMLGAKYGNDIPIVGQIVGSLFEVGEAMLAATRRIGATISENYNQGCIFRKGEGDYNSQGNAQVESFHAQFPGIQVCPLFYEPKEGGGTPNRRRPQNEVVRPAIYQAAYFNFDNAVDLYFYTSGKWVKGVTSPLHAGEKDIRNIVAWLRSNGLAELALNTEMVIAMYNHPIGFTALQKRLQDKINTLQKVLFAPGAPVNQLVRNGCAERKIENYLDPIIKLSRLYDFFPQDDQPQWSNIINQYDWPWRQMLFQAQMTAYADYLKQQKYLGANQNINPEKFLEEVINNVNFHVLKISGSIKNADGTPAVGIRAKFDIQFELFPGNSKQCLQEYADENGRFKYFYVMSRFSSKTHEISAVNPDGQEVVEQIEFDPEAQKYYTVHLQFPQNCPEDYEWNATLGKCEKQCGANAHPQGTGLNQICVCDSGYTWNSTRTNCIKIPGADSTTTPDSTQTSPNPCANIANAVPILDSLTQVIECKCEAPLVLNNAQTKCISKKEKALENLDCTGIANTEPKWDATIQDAICDCKEGYEWNGTRTECIETGRPPDDYCDVFPNTKIVQTENGAWACNCIADYVWNENHDACITKQQDLINRADCSNFPNAEAKWSAAENDVICDCKQGYKWNDQGVCIPTDATAAVLADCSIYPNTKPQWSDLDSAIVCNCLEGYEWKQDLSGCEKVSKTKLCDEAYPNTVAVLDRRTNEYFCECRKGYEWNKNETACVPTESTAIANSDCYKIPNAIAKYSARTQTVRCICKTGYRWNSDGSACEKDPQFEENISQITDALINIGTQINQGGTVDSPENPSVDPENQHEGECNTKYSGSGANVPQQYTIPYTGGTLTLWYNTLTIKDRIHVYQGGKKIYDSGCVGTENSVELQTSALSMGGIKIIIDPRCDGTDDTRWHFQLNCSNP